MDRTSRLLVAGAVVLGVALRLYQITGQILVSDEWHALHAVAQTPARELLSLVTIGASSIPVNLYYRLLLDTVGWSEMWLRLPSLIAGVSSVVILPLLARRFLRPRANVLFAYLVAVSPLLIFYSRYCRPYSLVMLLTFVALVACWAWARSGRVRDAVVFAASGTLAAYVHVPELRSFLAPLLVLVALKLFPRSRALVRPSLGALLLVGLVPTLLVALLLLPGFFNPAQFLTPIVGRSQPEMATLLGVGELLAGTANPVARAVFAGLAALGFGLLVRRDRLLGALLAAAITAGVAMMVLLGPLDAEIPITFTRYVIASVPLVLMAVATGIDGALAFLESRSSFSGATARVASGCLAAAALAALVWLGPLPRTYRHRNDFTNHKAFQASYGRFESNPYTLGFRRLAADMDARGEVVAPVFYDRLAGDAACGSIIEYPLFVGDLNSPYFLYQARHDKRVLGGYFHAPRSQPATIRRGVVPATWIVDEVLAEVQDPAKLRFRNLVDLRDAAAVRESGACYLIVHTNPPSEFAGESRTDRPMPAPVIDLGGRFGRPIFADAWTTVFELRRPAD